MNLYRSLLLWLALAVLGALGWHWFSQDLGDVVIRFRGLTYTTTLAFLVVAWGLLWFALWALGWLLGLPLRAWRRHARTQARNRLVSGLEALHQGRHARAAELLGKAAEEPDVRTVALQGARRAALAAGDLEAAARHQSALAAHAPMAAALDLAERLLGEGRAEEALAALAVPNASPTPRGLRLQAEALSAAGRAAEALNLLPALKREQAVDADALAALEARYSAAALAQSAQADALLQRWRALPGRLQLHTAVVAAFARRAAALGLEDEGLQALAAALEAGWDESLATLYGELPAGRGEARRARAEAWLARHPSSPGLLLTLGRLAEGGAAEEFLHRAIAQGGGAAAWEALADRYAARGDERAAIAYANALRLARGETPLSLGGRSLREQIAAEAVAEQRNEHGLPLLPR